MENKIEQLTEKVYLEGVEKGKAEAQRIVEEARTQAEKIVKEAQAQAQDIVGEAQKNATSLDQNTRAELKMFAGQAFNALKSQVTDMVSNRVVEEALKGAAKDNVLNEFILTLAKRWSVDEPVTIEAAEAQQLKSYFAAKAKELLDGKVTIKQVNGQKTQFSIAPAGGAYKINFGEEEFAAYFKAFLRPQIAELLF